MERKIIQITCDNSGGLYALCSDGTIWRMLTKYINYGWEEVPNDVNEESRKNALLRRQKEMAETARLAAQLSNL